MRDDLPVASPRELGLDSDRWQAVLETAADLCARDVIPAIGLSFGRGGLTTGTHLFGRQQIAANEPIRKDAIFLIASITKPLVAMALLRLVERGRLTLGDRVCDHLPEFGGAGRYPTTIRHLLTHTSGLPDMLPNNRALRMERSPLSRFVEGTCGVTPDFQPGRGVQYQSMGFALLGEIIARTSGSSCAEFLRREFFNPLGMNDTALGAPDEWLQGSEPRIQRIPEIRLPPEQDPRHDWHWNSTYWRQLGAPWGGLLTTPADLSRYARMMLNGGTLGSARVLGRATISAATRNQLEVMPEVPEEDRRIKPWGFGWRLHWAAHSANFGDLLGPRTYGHWGATGTVLWIDPDHDIFFVLFTTQPMEPHGTHLARLSNLAAAAII